MLGFDATSGAAMPPVWVAGAAAAMAAAGAGLLVAAGWRGGAGRRVLAGLAVMVAIGLAAWTAELAAAAQARRAERHALAVRLAELTGRALVPGSPLACLDGLAGTAAEPACEAVLLGRPETTAAAVTYVATQLALLGEAAPAARRDPALVPVLAPLRRALAADRFGVVAHVLAQRAGCTPESCAALGLLDDTERVRANLRDHRFELLLARNVASWPGGGALAAGDTLTGSAAAGQGFPLSSSPAPALAGTGQPAAGGPGSASGQPTGGRPASSRYDFPSAASIPPVSIMSPEPAGPPPQVGARDIPAPTPGTAGAAPPARKPAAAAPAAATPAAPPTRASTRPAAPPPASSGPPATTRPVPLAPPTSADD